MPCMCGDTECPSCGPAQGAPPTERAELPEQPSCPSCGVEALHRDVHCGVLVCLECYHHIGLVRCYCGWASDGGDGRAQLIDLGETL